MTFQPKDCADCGAPFQPTSGAQKWCTPCRPIRGKRLEGDELVEALQARAERREEYQHSETRAMLEAAKVQLKRNKETMESNQRLYDVVAEYAEGDVDPTVLEAAARYLQRREVILARGQVWHDQFVEDVADLEMLVAQERAQR